PMAPFVLTMPLACLVAIDSRHLIQLAKKPLLPAGGYGWGTPLFVLVGGAALIGVGFGTDALWDFGLGFIVLGGIAVGIAALSLFVAHLPTDDPASTTPAAPRMTALLAAIPAVALGVVALRASFSEI